MRLPLYIIIVAQWAFTAVAFSHGSLEWPKSRVKRVYEAMNQTPRPVWAAQAISLDGEQAYYTWNQLSRNFPAAINGSPQAYFDNIPDGQLASAGNTPTTATLPGHPGLSFSGLDTLSPSWEWPATPVTAGVNQFTFHATAPHDPSFFKVWISKAGHDVRTPLRWQDLDYLGQPGHSRTGSSYFFNVTLPARTGRAVVYVAWQRVDPAGEVFFAMSDVDFGGGAGTNEQPVAGFTTPTVTVNESTGQAAVTVSLSAAAPGTGVQVDYATTPGTAGAGDFTTTAGTLTFAAGQLSKTITLPIANDTIQESPEVFVITLSHPTGAVLGQSTAQVTINDDDAPPGAAGAYRFVVTQNWGSGWEGKLELVNTSGSAWSPWTLDFDAPWTIGNAYNGELVSHIGNHYTYGPNAWNGTVAAGATLVFDWLVSNAGGLGATAPTNVRLNGQLLGPLDPGVAIESVALYEGDSSVTVPFTITLENPHTSNISVAWQTLSGSALAGSDFTSAGGAVVFAPGQTSKTVSVTILGDTVQELAETFTIALAAVDGQPLPRFVTGKQTATITLRDDDSPPAVWVAGGVAMEGNAGTAPLNFKLWLSRAPKAGESISLHYGTMNGTAVAADDSMAAMGVTCQCQPMTNSCDYTAVSGTAVFSPGVSSLVIPVPIKGDTRDEDLETFQFQIDSLVGCVARNTTATGQIVDDDMVGSQLGPQRRVVAYADATAGSVNLPSASRVTHLLAAFADIGPTGALANTPNLTGWNALKSGNRSLRVLLSVGGWNWSSSFTAMANDPAKRTTFATSCRTFVEAQGIDGIDLDWEWPGGGNTVPNANDRANFTALVHAVRVALNELGTVTGKSYELTCYAPATAANLAFWDLPALAQDFDFFNVQSYDLHGPWDSITGHQSGLTPNPSKNDGLYVSQVLALYTNAGVPKSKLLLGAPFYAYYWTNVGPTQNGFNQPGGGSSDLTYAALNATNGWASQFIRSWDPYAQVPSLYEPTASGTGRWVSYDDPQSLHAKALHCRNEGYGGVFFWQLGGDTADHQLLTTLSDSLADPPATDTDGDQLPDAWEIAHFGNLTTANASTDSDHDGAGDLLEFRARTQPADPRDLPCLTLHRHTDNSWMLMLPTASRVRYRIERSVDFLNWSPLSSFTGTGASSLLSDPSLPAQTPRAFYRLVLPVP